MKPCFEAHIIIKRAKIERIVYDSKTQRNELKLGDREEL